MGRAHGGAPAGRLLGNGVTGRAGVHVPRVRTRSPGRALGDPAARPTVRHSSPTPPWPHPSVAQRTTPSPPPPTTIPPPLTPPHPPTLIRQEEKVLLVTHSISCFIYLVTAGHEQVGRVQAYAQDPTFASFSWSAKVRAPPLHASRATTALPREGCGEGHRIGTSLAGAAQGKVHLGRLDPRMAAHALFRCATRA